MLFDFLVQIYGGTADRIENQQLGGSDLQEHGQSRHVNQVTHKLVFSVLSSPSSLNPSLP
jgi:hypothetical protein